MTWVIQRLISTHDRHGFDSGNPPLDDFLVRLSSQYERRNLARTYAATRTDENRVVGYYSLASGAVRFESLPEVIAKKLPRHPVPVAVLARLAVDRSVQGQGLGRVLIGDALTRCVALSDQIGIHAVFVEAVDEEAVRFYERFGFIPLKDQPDKLFLRIDTARAALPGS